MKGVVILVWVIFIVDCLSTYFITNLEKEKVTRRVIKRLYFNAIPKKPYCTYQYKGLFDND